MRSFASLRMTPWCRPFQMGRPGSRVLGRNGEGGFRAADIFEAVIGTYRDRVLAFTRGGCAPSEAEGELVVFFRRVADRTRRRNGDPVVPGCPVLNAFHATCALPRPQVF